jgi:hypothetical protein
MPAAKPFGQKPFSRKTSISNLFELASLLVFRLMYYGKHLFFAISAQKNKANIQPIRPQDAH